MIRLSICILTAAGIALSGCGSSSGGGISFAERARDVTNAESPALTPAQIQQGIERLASNGNGLFVETSRLHVQTDNENIQDIVIDSDCMNFTCTYTSMNDNLNEFLPSDEFGFTLTSDTGADESERQVVLTKNGVTTNLIEIERRLGPVDIWGCDLA